MRVTQSHESPIGDPTAHTACCCPLSCRFATATTDLFQQGATATEFSSPLHPWLLPLARGQHLTSHDYTFSSSTGSINTVEDASTQFALWTSEWLRCIRRRWPRCNTNPQTEDDLKTMWTGKSTIFRGVTPRSMILTFRRNLLPSSSLLLAKYIEAARTSQMVRVDLILRHRTPIVTAVRNASNIKMCKNVSAPPRISQYRNKTGLLKVPSRFPRKLREYLQNL
jgi:hypothetical protein